MSHLEKRISALVDGELGHEARDRALAHVAHCSACRDRLSAERALKERVSSAPAPAPSGQLVRALLEIADAPAAGMRSRGSAVQPIVPPLPALTPGSWLRRPGGRTDARRPGAGRTARRGRYAAAGALSVGVLVFGTAFAAGGSGSGQVAVVPPAAELSVEHAATTSGLPLRDGAFDAVTAGLGGVSFPTPAAVVNR